MPRQGDALDVTALLGASGTQGAKSSSTWDRSACRQRARSSLPSLRGALYLVDEVTGGRGELGLCKRAWTRVDAMLGVLSTFPHTSVFCSSPVRPRLSGWGGKGRLSHCPTLLECGLGEHVCVCVHRGIACPLP